MEKYIQNVSSFRRKYCKIPRSFVIQSNIENVNMDFSFSPMEKLFLYVTEVYYVT